MIIIRQKKFFYIFLVFFLFNFSIYADDSKKPILRIAIEGNKIISDATILSKIKVRANQPFSSDLVNEDLKNLYATGFFDKVDAKKEDTEDGVILTFMLKEKAILKKVEIEGAKSIRIKKIEEVLDLKEGGFIDEYKIEEATNKLYDYYKKRGFFQTKIEHILKIDEEKNEATIKFVINENRKLKIRQVNFVGNKKFSKKELIRLIKTRPNWIFNQQPFNEETFADDIKRIKDFYERNGFGDVKVKEDIKFKNDGVYIDINIQEGKCYYIGKIEVVGNENVTTDQIRKVLKSKEGGIYSEQIIYQDISNIREIYMEKGYIFCQVEPISFLNTQTQKVDTTFKITENQIAYVEKINIYGNTKTKDKVIRRELRIYPQDRYDGKKIKKSKERLENLGFFEEIRFNTEAGTTPDSVNLNVDVKEAKTGYFSFGGGYSSINEFMGFIELRQRNFDYKNFSTFTGGGQDLSLYASLGTITDFYKLSFTNPWIFDVPISFGFDVYKRGHSREEDVGYAYSETVQGGDVRLGKEFNDYIKGQIAYRLDIVKIRDVIDTASQELKDEEGTTSLSSGELQLNFDTRDDVFNPTSGIYFPHTFQLTGGPFGGDKDFIKYFSRFSIYFPMINKSVIEFRLRVGFADPFSGTSKLPIYERFFAGGANTIRGYSERKVGPVDSITNDPIGGEALFVGNIEYSYPLIDFLKIAAFFDTGNVWKKNGDFLSGDLKSSVGFGVRVKTPIGPISVDYGLPLDKEEGKEDKKGKFHFSVSRNF
ncbi:MAG: outer membrane protein assembly factor BamA [Candidatus Omnitrophica bacterium]|nr:outer membrane protein assembly factor BamA [Candidatus Omnitrophota bacterium]